MFLKFNNDLIVSTKFDAECAALADMHYSRQTHGSNQFMPPGKTIVIRNAEGTLVFGWLWQAFRDDGQEGFNCCIFRNESGELSSSVIRQAEQIAVKFWGPARAFTYVDPSQLRSTNPGCCFKKAGWKVCGKSKSGKVLLDKRLSQEVLDFSEVTP